MHVDDRDASRLGTRSAQSEYEYARFARAGRRGEPFLRLSYCLRRCTTMDRLVADHCRAKGWPWQHTKSKTSSATESRQARSRSDERSRHASRGRKRRVSVDALRAPGDDGASRGVTCVRERARERESVTERGCWRGICGTRRRLRGPRTRCDLTSSATSTRGSVVVRRHSGVRRTDD